MARRRRQEGLKRARFRGTPSETPRHAEESLAVRPLRELPGGPWHHGSIINNDLIGFDRGASKILERHLINVIELFNPCLWEDGACEPV